MYAYGTSFWNFSEERSFVPEFPRLRSLQPSHHVLAGRSCMKQNEKSVFRRSREKPAVVRGIAIRNVH